MEWEDRSEEGKARQGRFDLGKGKGHVDGWGERVGTVALRVAVEDEVIERCGG